ncbi:hypothetical protein ACFVRB_20205 [Streptomyces nojiriensis]|uniref:hypothetical protein n=1 Tax=Streptomyces nojiriensis TaxID=66374 RepID=UPI0036DD3FED
MAAIVYFRKISETEELVEYEFGDAPENFERRLTMDKASCTSTVQDEQVEQVDYTFLKASRKLNALYTERGVWPERGMSVS